MAATPPPALPNSENPIVDRMRQLIANEPGAIADIMRPQPVFAQGKQRGYRVYPGRNRQAFIRLGLRPGDLVTAINGTPLDDPARGQEVFATLGSSSEAHVTVMRNGRQQDLTLKWPRSRRKRKRSSARATVPPRHRTWLRPRRMALAVNSPVECSSGAAQRRGTLRMTVTGSFSRRRARIAGWAALLTVVGSLASAQQQPTQRITPNFKDADIVQIAEAVGAATGKNFILDPRVRAQVTMLSSTPMTPDAFYEAFLSILQVHSFVAMPAGNNIVKIVPDASARTMPGEDLPARVSGTSDEIVTQVIQVKNVNAAQLVPILRSLIPQNGHLAAYQPSNILIISDRAANVNRIMRIIQRIDQAGDTDVEIMPLQNASAADIVRVITTLYQQQAQRRRRQPDEARGRRPLEQRAHQRRPLAAPAHQDAHRAPRHAVRGWRRHASALPALCGCGEDRAEAQGADHGTGTGCHARRRGCRRPARPRLPTRRP